jgi:hypothetical protein
LPMPAVRNSTVRKAARSPEKATRAGEGPRDSVQRTRVDESREATRAAERIRARLAELRGREQDEERNPFT